MHAADWLCVMNNRWSARGNCGASVLSQILPPLRDVATRPEQGDTVKSRLVRLMTHVDTDVKHCAAELLFVLCKENGTHPYQAHEPSSAECCNDWPFYAGARVFLGPTRCFKN